MARKFALVKDPKTEEECRVIQAELLEPLPEQLPEKRPPYEIDSPQKAEFVVSLFRAVEDRQRCLDEQYEAMQRELADRQRYLEWRFFEQLRLFAENNLEGKSRSIKFLTGTIGFRKVAPRLEVESNERAIAWAEENDPMRFLAYDPRLNLQVIKDEWTAGKIKVPAGMTVIPEQDRFYVK